MRHLAITGMLTASWMPLTISGSDMRATPPSRRMSAGTRSSAITATAPDASAIFACSASTRSMITPPFNISARPLFTRIVPYSLMRPSLARVLWCEAAVDLLVVVGHRRDRPDHDGVPVRPQDVAEVRAETRRRVCPEGLRGPVDRRLVLR